MKTQFEVFTAVMNNFGDAQKALTLALNSSGSAMKENEAYMESLQAKVNNLKAQFTELVLGGGGLTSFIKLILETGTAILKFANSDIGQFIIKATLLISTINLLNKSLKSLEIVDRLTVLYRSLTQETVMLANGMGTMVTGTHSLTKGLLSLTSAWLSSPFAMLTIGLTAIYGIVKAIEYFNVSLEESVEELNELKSAYDQTKSELDGLEKQLESVQDKINAISNSELKITDDEELKLLLEQESNLKRQVALLKTKQEIEQKDLEEQAKKVLGTEISSRYSTETLGSSYSDLGYIGPNADQQIVRAKTVSQTEELNIVTDQYKKLNEERQKLIQTNNSLVDSEGNILEGNEETFKANEESISQLETQMNSVKEYGTTLADTIQTSIESIDGSDKAEKELINTNEKALDGFYAIIGAYEDVSDESENYSDTLEGIVKTNDELEESLNSIQDGLDSIQNAYNTLSGAVEEYNSNGSLTLDTLQDLLALDNDYINALDIQNGQLVLNEEYLRNKALAQLEATKQLIIDTAMAELNEIAKQNAETANSNMDSEFSDTSGIEQNTDALTKNTEATVKNAAAKLIEQGASPEEAEEINGVLERMSTKLELVSDYANNFGNNMASSMGKATSATKKQSDALEELKDQYKNVIDSINAQLDIQITALERARDDELDYLNDKKEALEDQRDAEIKALEDQKEALEKEKEEREKYWDERINALKKENEEREKNIKLQQLEEALARAKATKVKVFDDEENRFVYKQDESAVEEAEYNLDSYKQELEYEEQLEALEELKEAEMENYEERISALDDYIEQVQERFDQQIEALENHIEQVEEQYNRQIESLKRFQEDIKQQYDLEIANLQATTSREGAEWNNRLAQLQANVNRYNAILGQMRTASFSVPKLGFATGTTSVSKNQVAWVGERYASGTTSVPDNKMALVGDKPNRELVLGSKLNNDSGVLMSLKRGTGVIPHTLTEKLLNIASSVSSIRRNESPAVNNKSISNSTKINIENISLPQVKDGNDFVQYLKNNFMNDSIQIANARV